MTFARPTAASTTRRAALSLCGLLACLAWAGAPAPAPAGPVVPAMSPPVRPAEVPLETAIFAGGCFWGVEAVFEQVDGVTSAVSGYIGGDPATATYAQTSTGLTGHAEAVEVTFDPRVVRYEDLLRVFFLVAHDPTQLDRQGPDVGSQYRSALFPGPGQEATARAVLDGLRTSGTFDRPVVTTVEPRTAFTLAEPEHQDYVARHPASPYVVCHDLPRLRALAELFPDLVRPEVTR